MPLKWMLAASSPGCMLGLGEIPVVLKPYCTLQKPGKHAPCKVRSSGRNTVLPRLSSAPLSSQFWCYFLLSVFSLPVPQRSVLMTFILTTHMPRPLRRIAAVPKSRVTEPRSGNSFVTFPACPPLPHAARPCLTSSELLLSALPLVPRSQLLLDPRPSLWPQGLSLCHSSGIAFRSFPLCPSRTQTTVNCWENASAVCVAAARSPACPEGPLLSETRSFTSPRHLDP